MDYVDKPFYARIPLLEAILSSLTTIQFYASIGVYKPKNEWIMWISRYTSIGVYKLKLDGICRQAVLTLVFSCLISIYSKK